LSFFNLASISSVACFGEDIYMKF